MPNYGTPIIHLVRQELGELLPDGFDVEIHKEKIWQVQVHYTYNGHKRVCATVLWYRRTTVLLALRLWSSGSHLYDVADPDFGIKMVREIKSIARWNWKLISKVKSEPIV